MKASVPINVTSVIVTLDRKGTGPDRCDAVWGHKIDKCNDCGDLTSVTITRDVKIIDQGTRFLALPICPEALPYMSGAIFSIACFNHMR